MRERGPETKAFCFDTFGPSWEHPPVSNRRNRIFVLRFLISLHLAQWARPASFIFGRNAKSQADRLSRGGLGPPAGRFCPDRRRALGGRRCGAVTTTLGVSQTAVDDNWTQSAVTRDLVQDVLTSNHRLSPTTILASLHRVRPDRSSEAWYDTARILALQISGRPGAQRWFRTTSWPHWNGSQAWGLAGEPCPSLAPSHGKGPAPNP